MKFKIFLWGNNTLFIGNGLPTSDARCSPHLLLGLCNETCEGLVGLTCRTLSLLRGAATADAGEGPELSPRSLDVFQEAVLDIVPRTPVWTSTLLNLRLRNIGFILSAFLDRNALLLHTPDHSRRRRISAPWALRWLAGGTRCWGMGRPEDTALPHRVQDPPAGGAPPAVAILFHRCRRRGFLSCRGQVKRRV